MLAAGPPAVLNGLVPAAVDSARPGRADSPMRLVDRHCGGVDPPTWSAHVDRGHSHSPLSSGLLVWLSRFVPLLVMPATTETEVAGGTSDGMSLPGRRPVRVTIGRRAQVRAALRRPPVLFAEQSLGPAARRGRGGGNVEQSETVGREAFDRRRAGETVRVQFTPVQRAARPLGMFPRCARGPGPPAHPVIQRHRARVPTNSWDPGTRSAGSAPGKSAGSGAPLGDRPMAGVGDEAAELGIGHRVLVQPEVGSLGAAQRPLLGIEVHAAHHEGTARYQDHALGRN